MPSLLWLVVAAFNIVSVLAVDYPICRSFGMDFQHRGSYFQNSLSSDSFTFVSQFLDCQDDTAYNVLVDPNGDQYLCTDTQLRPDNTNMLSTCPILKNQLSSGPWSILIVSNNGDANPIAYERDFELSVGPQSTTTETPTATATFVSTPVITATSTITDTVTTVLSPSTITSPSVTVTRTKTYTPARVTTTSTKALFTLRFTSIKLEISKVTQTKTATCRRPFRQPTPDPVARIRPTVGPAARVMSPKFRREIEAEKARFVEERRIRFVERAPDPQPLTVTETDTAKWQTVTSTSTAPATTAFISSTLLTTTTSTPPPVVVLSGKTTAAIVTVTAPTPTRTITRYNIATSITTKTKTFVYTVRTTITPSSVASACKTAGGIIW
ncbi:hypothetical protein BU24DRAFT_445873 [Aaosphaeria arxii CBS 175.79]|uniref:Uncharacterized protein n=1 Tax=Aaosphaeria arxii CBS 175.79 TaxID=1450172 RepID=A0A6A5Y5D4_9PLEO|nr:uncharacterized protein BU24DRAFT_445873 [Aaosphaeria arxii CBS 175.79]KAF2020698.1 hypothetical protein BU24DRAFT_445873 [Aaosphaeria arxii CBS 175.79]